MRTDPGPSLTPLNFFISLDNAILIQIAALVFLIGAVLSLFIDEGVSILVLGFIFTALAMEYYRVYFLGQDLNWGLGLYLATGAILLCTLDTFLRLKERRAGRKVRNDVTSFAQEEN